MLKPAVVTAKRSKTWMSKVKSILSTLLEKVQGIWCISGDARRISPQSLSVNVGEKKSLSIILCIDFFVYSDLGAASFSLCSPGHWLDQAIRILIKAAWVCGDIWFLLFWWLLLIINHCPTALSPPCYVLGPLSHVGVQLLGVLPHVGPCVSFQPRPNNLLVGSQPPHIHGDLKSKASFLDSRA